MKYIALPGATSRHIGPSLQALVLDSIDFRMIQSEYAPVLVKGKGEGLVLVRIGFMLSLTEGSTLRWLRFKVDILGNDGPSTPLEHLPIISFLPVRVDREIVLGGHIAVSDDGQLNAQSVLPEQAGAGAMRFKPFIVGYKIGDVGLVWDYLPSERDPPSCFQNMSVTVKAGRFANLYTRVSIRLCTEGAKSGKQYSATSPEMQVVRRTADV
jgi:hypothetical protein